MAEDRCDELLALKRMIETCRAQAIDLGMPALSYILTKAESSLEIHSAPQALPRGPALSVPRGRIVRH